MINETYSTFVQGFMPTLGRPTSTSSRVDDSDHRRPGADGANIRSTVGTVTDVNAMLRILFSHAWAFRISARGLLVQCRLDLRGRAPSR